MVDNGKERPNFSHHSFGHSSFWGFWVAVMKSFRYYFKWDHCQCTNMDVCLYVRCVYERRKVDRREVLTMENECNYKQIDWAPRDEWKFVFVHLFWNAKSQRTTNITRQWYHLFGVGSYYKVCRVSFRRNQPVLDRFYVWILYCTCVFIRMKNFLLALQWRGFFKIKHTCDKHMANMIYTNWKFDLFLAALSASRTNWKGHNPFTVTHILLQFTILLFSTQNLCV